MSPGNFMLMREQAFKIKKACKYVAGKAILPSHISTNCFTQIELSPVITEWQNIFIS